MDGFCDDLNESDSHPTVSYVWLLGPHLMKPYGIRWYGFAGGNISWGVIWDCKASMPFPDSSLCSFAYASG